MFPFATCAEPGCSALALSGSGRCAAHLADRAAFTAARVISRIEHGCPLDMALRWVIREGTRAVDARGDSGRR